MANFGATVSRVALTLAALGAFAAPAVALDSDADNAIVVTAQRQAASSGTKTDTPLIETPQAVSVIDSDTFEAQGAQTLQDILLYSAGVRSDTYGLDSRGDWAFVRGSESWVQYIDGLRMIAGYNNTPKPDPYTLARVEIVRGPSSVLYGQGATVGVVNLVSKTPVDEFGGEIGVQFGSFDRRQVQGDVTGPLGADWSYRVVGLFRESDSNIDYVPDDRRLLAPSLTWRPSGDTTFTLRALYQSDDSGSSTSFLPHSGTVLPNPNGQIPFNRFVSEPGFDQYDTEIGSIGWSFEHRFGETWRFRQNFRYAESSVDYVSMYPDVFSNPADPFIDANDRVVDRNVYVERSDARALGLDNHVQADFTTGAVEHTVLVGLDYGRFHEEEESGFDCSHTDPAFGCTPGFVTPIDLYDPVYAGQAMPPLNRLPDVTTTQVGLYLQDQLTISDRWIVVGGVRRDYANNEIEGAEDQTDWATTYRLGAMYRSSGGLAPYVSYSESFIPVGGTDRFGARFKPQSGEQWELGLKFQPDGAPYILTAAAFEIIEQNRLTPDPVDPNYSVQTGEVRLSGVEFEGAGRVLENTDVVVSYSYTEAEITESNTAEEIGRQLEGVPYHLAAAWILHTIPLGADTEIEAGFGLRYVGETNAYPLLGGAITVPAETLADASLAFNRRSWRLAITANNLFDDDYIATCLGRGDCFVGTPRRVIATLAYRF